jgi:hypothetical protein
MIRAMKWTPLFTIALEDWFSPKLRTAAGELNARIQDLLRQRSQLEQAIARQHAEDVATVDMTNLAGFPALGVSVLDLLQCELRLRREVASFWGEYFPACERAAQKAAEGHRKTEEKILAGLGELGFPLELPDRAPWLPGVIAHHPKIQAARQRKDGLRDKARSRERQRENSEAIERLTRELETAVSRGLPA